MDDTPHITPLRSLDEMRAAVDLQKTFWGDNLESVIPAHMLYSLANHGGHVLAATLDNSMVGVLVGFLGTTDEDSHRPAMANLQIVSKRMVVLPAYRNRGIAYRLKLAQRDMALKQGVRLVTWTFDPLLSTNAHLNVRKLGVMCQRYYQDYYGVDDDSGLATLGSSDRLLAEWWVTHRRVEERLFGKRGDLTLKMYFEAETPILNPTTLDVSGLPLPAGAILHPTGSLALLEIPRDFNAIVATSPALAQQWRLHIREAFLRLFTQGYMVTDFLHEVHEGRERAFYLLSYNGPQFEAFSRN